MILVAGPIGERRPRGSPSRRLSGPADRQEVGLCEDPASRHHSAERFP
jgi:hypothetical protein